MDELFGAMASKIRDHNFIHAELASLHEPLPCLVEVGEDRPHLQIVYSF
jgi:hypothetical protein